MVRNGVFFNSFQQGREEEPPQDFVITTRQQYGLPDDAIVFCNFQQLYKINPQIMKIWMNVSVVAFYFLGINSLLMIFCVNRF